MSGDDKKPVWVHYGDCGHEWVLFYTPINASDMAKFTKSPCPMCVSKKVFMGQRPKETVAMAARALPPDPEGMNDARAEWAGAGLGHFQCTTGTGYEDSLGDLLGDLMHWADRNSFDFNLALERARGCYREETAEVTP